MKYRGTIAYRAGLGGNVPEGFLGSVVPAWDFLVQNYSTPASHFHFMRGLSCMLHDSANQVAQMFMGDWVLFLDTDHVFKSDAFYEMVTTFEENNLDLLTGFAQKRQPPYLPLIMDTKNFNPLMRWEQIVPGPIEKHSLIPVDAAGLACVLVRRRVFDAIKEKLDEKPFDFRSEFAPKVVVSAPEGIWNGHNGPVPDPSFALPAGSRWDDYFWEDISFFWRAKLLGFQMYCAPWIKFHHIETRMVTDDMMQTVPPGVVPQ